MGGCNRCDGGFIRHTAGHGDTRSEKCPWCRIAELEAKLAMVEDICTQYANRDFDEGEFASMVCYALDPRIEVLAVVDGYVWADFAEEFSRYAFSVAKDQVDDFDDADSVHIPVRVIVLPNKEKP